MATVDDQIAQANAAAADAESKAEAKINSALTEAQATAFVEPGQGDFETGTPDWNLAPVDVGPLPPYNPNVQLADVYSADFNTTWADLEGWLRGLMADWMNTHFPTLDPALIAAEDAWLLNVVNNGYSGIPAAVEQMMWDRARAKDTIESLRLEEEALTQFSARGFSLPPGVLAGRLLQVQMDATNRSSTIARDQAIKQIEITIEMTKFAIGEITKLRLGIAQALADFIRAWTALPQAAADIAKAKADMNRVLWESSADYIRAQVAVGQLALDARKSNQATAVELAKFDVDAAVRQADRRASTAMQGAYNLASIAASARSSQNTMVSSITTAASNA